MDKQDIIGEKSWGIIYNSVAKVQSEGNHQSEIVTEVLLGTPVKILDKKKGWRQIQTPEGYIGWVSESVTPVTQSELTKYNQQQKIIVTSHYAHSYEKNTAKSRIISDLTIGNLLVIKGSKGKFFQVVYPDGREAFVKKSDAKKFDNWLKDIRLTEQSIVETATQMTGIPYVWGGTSSKGLDCSGFTKLVYFLHGVILLRDASQQAKTGKLVDEIGNFANLQVGDLVFFGTKPTEENPQERVTHVGIYLGNGRFIHASDYIKTASFYPNDELYDAFNTNRYLRAKRILGEINTTGIEKITENKFYK
ncbi:MAG: C40 family peptidase [Capnocytophaga sp.]|nr:C40 family peptidase [Capnocytophaga sp.]